MAEDSSAVKEALTRWIRLDDEARTLQQRLKQIRDEKQKFGESVLRFMRENSVDDFKLDGMTGGSISRSVRTTKPPIKRNTIRTQLLLHFSDQPQRVSEALKAIEGIPEGVDDMMSVGTQRELLTRRLPKAPRQQMDLSAIASTM
jgi:hypothetical protein